MSNVTLFTQVSEVNVSFLLLSAKQATLEQRRLFSVALLFSNVKLSVSHSYKRAYRVVSITLLNRIGKHCTQDEFPATDPVSWNFTRHGRGAIGESSP